jgi:membrane protease YdiL (CAAX protease family)
MPGIPRKRSARLALVYVALAIAAAAGQPVTEAPAPKGQAPSSDPPANPAPLPDEAIDTSRDDEPARPRPPAPEDRRERIEEDENGFPLGEKARSRARFKSDLLLPFGSALLPGFGQYFQGDGSGAAYSVTALAGLTLFLASAPAALSESATDPLSGGGPGWWPYRTLILGGLAYQGSGFLSAYSAFRSSVPRFQDENGMYRFLGPRESIGELMRSPFRFDHLARPSAWIPLGLLAGIVGYQVANPESDGRFARWTASADDYLFVGAESWNAGVTEEAVFRGWIYPVSYQYLWQNFWVADGAQALVFGAAHYGASNPLPWPQALLGFYFGWLARKNDWSLSESIFVHAWWDMLLFAGELAAPGAIHSRASFRMSVPILW